MRGNDAKLHACFGQICAVVGGIFTVAGLLDSVGALVCKNAGGLGKLRWTSTGTSHA